MFKFWLSDIILTCYFDISVTKDDLIIVPLLRSKQSLPNAKLRAGPIPLQQLQLSYNSCFVLSTNLHCR